MPQITLDRKQLVALETFFAGFRDRRVSVHQDLDSGCVNFSTPPSKHASEPLYAVVTLADVEALCVEADSTPGAGIFLAAAIALPARPSRFSAGSDLAVGTYHVEAIAGDNFTIVRAIGVARWFPLTARENPAWLLWTSYREASSWVETQDGDLCDYPFWGR